MTIQQIIEGKYHCFSHVEDKRKRMEYISAAKYIRNLSSASGIDISHWNILELFKLGDAIETDKIKINKIFFLSKDHKPKYEGLTIAQVRALDNFYVRGRDEASNHALKRHQNFVIQSTAHSEQALNMLKLARSEWLKYESSLGQKRNFSAEVEDIIKGGFYKLRSVANGMLEFATPEITLSYINIQHKAKYSVNLGSFLVRVDLASSLVRVLKRENNTLISNYSSGSLYYHPHVAHDGVVCFGEEREIYNELICTGRVHPALEILQSVLCTFEESNPYCQLSKFKEEIDKREKKEWEDKVQEENKPNGEVLVTF